MRRRVLVLGGAGFAGRHAVSSLLKMDAEVIIGTRNPETMDSRCLSAAKDCRKRSIALECLTDPASWRDHLCDVDVVLNCVGILRQRGAATYDRIHNLAPAALAEACARHDKRLVHLSALGLRQDARSRFISSKILGEASVQRSPADWIIARPSLLDGDGGFGARWLRGVSRLPAFFTPSGAKGRIAALDVSDLGEALARLCLASSADLGLEHSRIFELGGEDEYLFHEYIRAIRKTHSDRRSIQIRVPNQLARVFSHLCDIVHFTPFSFGHWEMLQDDNKPTANRLPELLGRPPTNVPLKIFPQSSD